MFSQFIAEQTEPHLICRLPVGFSTCYITNTPVTSSLVTLFLLLVFFRGAIHLFRFCIIRSPSSFFLIPYDLVLPLVAVIWLAMSLWIALIHDLVHSEATNYLQMNCTCTRGAEHEISPH